MESSNTTRRCSWSRPLLTQLMLCSLLVLGIATVASASSAALWIANEAQGTIVELQPNVLKKTNVSPPRVTLTPPASPYGVCFDKSNNLWITDITQEVVEYTSAQLKTLSSGANPLSPSVTITSSSSFKFVQGCAFDQHGNLWLADGNNASVDELSADQLTSSADVTPAVIITDSTEMTGGEPAFVSFDKSGNLWLPARGGVNKLLEFAAPSLNSNGNKTADVILSGGGSLAQPGQIAFDGKGNLWVSNFNDDDVLMFPKSSLASSNNTPPTVTLSIGVSPWGLAFRGKGPLWVMDDLDGAALEFLPSQLKKTGSPAPKVILGVNPEAWQITFGPKYGKP